MQQCGRLHGATHVHGSGFFPQVGRCSHAAAARRYGLGPQQQQLSIKVRASSESGSGFHEQQQQQQQGQNTNVDHKLPLKNAAFKAELLASLASQEKFSKIRLALQEDFKDLREDSTDPYVHPRDLEIAALQAELATLTELATLATKEDVKSLMQGVTDLTQDLTDDIRDLTQDLRQDIKDLRQGIEDMRRELKRRYQILNFVLGLLLLLVVGIRVV